MLRHGIIGRPIPRLDGSDKTTGSTKYTADLSPEGVLWGRILRSPWPHARVVNVDVSKALLIPGVHAVLKGSDVAGIRYGRRMHDVPVLADDKVRFIGDKVAAVAAVDRDTADEALLKINVDYEELDHVFDPQIAMGTEAPLIHPDVNNYRGLPKKLPRVSNVFIEDRWGQGDTETGFAASDIIIENTFSIPSQHQGYIETHSCVVSIDDNGIAQIWASCKVPFQVRDQLSVALGLPRDCIRVNPITIGGDYGGKGSAMDIPIAYFLALQSGRPVRIVMDYLEEFTAGNPRHSAVVNLKTGVMMDGTLVAHKAKVIFNSGAYGGFKPTPGVNLGGASKAGGPYRIPHTDIEAVHVYTNTVPGGFMRAPGEPQTLFASESHMDCIASKLQMDPAEFRLKNLVNDGDKTSIGTIYKAVRAKETLEAALTAANYRSSKKPHTGRGIAIAERPAAGGLSHSAVTLASDGSVVVNTSIFEPGTGTNNLLRQIVGEELNLDPSLIQVEVWDTDAVEFDTGVGGSRVTRIAGTAALRSAEQVRRELFSIGADLLGWAEEHIYIEGHILGNSITGETQRWPELLGRLGHPLKANVSINEPDHSDITSFTAQVAEVSVDLETGQIDLSKFVTAHDIGTVLNPMEHQGQIEGAVIQSIGFALTEGIEIYEGRVTNPTLGEYRLPNIKDIPELITVLVTSEEGSGPYNSRGIGENPLGPVAPAIANAIADATGIRIKSLPLTSEKLYQDLNDNSSLS